MFLPKHNQAIVDNIDRIKRVIRNAGVTRSPDNDIKFIDQVGKIINCNLYDDYHHIANRKYNDDDDSNDRSFSLKDRDDNRICFINDNNVMFCERTSLIGFSGYDKIDYQTIGYFQLRIELIKIVLTVPRYVVTSTDVRLKSSHI